MAICGLVKHIQDFGKYMKLPFTQQLINSNKFIRVFKNDTNIVDLVWHKDKNDRIIKSINTTNWQIQLDNQLPQIINKEIFIPKGVYHRLIKGTDNINLELEITEI